MHPIRQPYLLFLGDVQFKSDAKTAFGLRDWAREKVIGECALPSARITLGLDRLSPHEAAKRGAGSLVIGVAPVGGALPAHWVDTIVEAIEAGLDIVSGLHTRLDSFPRILIAASQSSVNLVEVRHLGGEFPAGTGRKRTGKRVLTVGTDCALGKKYTALALARALNDRGIPATFRATGQTGIMIAGTGVAIDAVISDFVAGAAEQLSPDNSPEHWDVIEGQGALFHPAYAGVTLGLLHGSQPDAIVLCHDPERTTIEGYPDFPVPSLRGAIDDYLHAGRLTNRDIRCIGVSVNSSSLDELEWNRYVSKISDEIGLPVVDPMRGGVEMLVQSLLVQ